MKISLRFSLLLSTCIFCFSGTSIFAQQAWDIFPTGQLTWWRTGDNLELHYNDSVEYAGNMRLHYFGKKYYEAAFGECLKDLKSDPPLPSDFYRLGGADTLFFNGEHYFLPFGQDTIRFFQAAIPGFQWVISIENGNADSFRMTCESMAEMEFLGFTDSVKTYSVQALKNGNPVNHALNDFDFELSKTAGFKRFFPFEWFAELPSAGELHTWNIAGFDNGIEYGFQNNVDAYFDHFQVGDKFLWRSSNTYQLFSDTLGERQVWQDSIKQVEITDSVVKIKLDRILYKDIYLPNSTAHSISLTKLNNQTDQSNKTQYEALFHSSTSYLNLLFPSYYSNALFFHQPYFKDGEVIEELNFTSFIVDGSKDSCWINPIADVPCMDVSLRAGVGIVWRYVCPVFTPPYTEQLLCLTRNGISQGSNCAPLWFYTAAAEPTLTDIQISAFPNPSKNELNIRTSGLPASTEPTRLTVLQPAGAALFFQDFSGEETQIPTDQLPPGIYFLKIEKAGQAAWLKFLKQ